jgi:hypothetical protein
MLKIKKNTIVIIFLLMGILPVYSQKLKYKELYPILKSDTITFALAKQLLTDYIKDESDFPNAYYQYACFCKKHLNDLDVLTETNLVIKYCDQAVSNYTHFLNIASEKDFKNNKEYYPEFVKNNAAGKPEIDFNQTTALIKQYITDLQNYSAHIKKISFLFYKSVDSYETARQIFLDINNRYLCENDLYLLADDTFLKNCTQLIASYDSAVFYLNAYSKSIKENPIPKYNQQFVFKKVETYRLDGFDAETSFLNKQITIWDYGFWTKKTVNIINTEIKDLRAKLEKTEKELSDGIKILKDSSQLFSLPSEYRFNKTTLLKLKKYDFNSPLLYLFNYQKNQLDWLLLKRNVKKYDSLTFGNEKHIFYGKVLKSLYACDSLLTDLKEASTEKTIQKHIAFINNFFGSKTGYFKYIETNQKEINNYLKDYLSKIYGSAFVILPDTENYVSYKDNLIPLFVSPTINSSSLYITTYLKKDASGNKYISGYYKNNLNDTLIKAFILKSTDNKVVWFKSYENPKSNSFANCLDIKNKEVITFITCTDNSNKTLSNTIVKLDLSGKEKSNKKTTFDFPVFCFTSDSTALNHFIISKTKGENTRENAEDLTLFLLNDNGIVLWKQQFLFKGNICEAFYTKTNYLLFGDFYFFYDGNQDYYGLSQGSDKTSVFAFSIDNTGKKYQFLPIRYKEDASLQFVNFFDTENIHLFARKNKAKQPLKRSDYLFLIVNSKLQLLFSESNN